MPSSVSLSSEQVTQLMTAVNTAGARKTPPYVFVSQTAWSTRLNVTVQAQDGSGFTMEESVHTSNGWQKKDAEFQQAVKDVIHQIDKDWGPF